MVAPVIKYPGSKTNIAPWIISHFPPHRVYVEPYYVSANGDCQSRQILVSPERVYSIAPERYLAKDLGERRVCSWGPNDWPDTTTLLKRIERVTVLDRTARNSQRTHEVREALRMLAEMFRGASDD